MKLEVGHKKHRTGYGSEVKYVLSHGFLLVSRATIRDEPFDIHGGCGIYS